MAADEEVQNLRKRQHDTADVVQVHAVKLALQEQTLATHAAQLAQLAASTITEEDLTAALGPIRGEQALQKQAMDTIKTALSDTATKDQLKNAIELVRSDSTVMRRDLADIQGSLTWVTRLIVGGVVTAVLALLYQVAK